MQKTPKKGWVAGGAAETAETFGPLDVHVIGTRSKWIPLVKVVDVKEVVESAFQGSVRHYPLSGSVGGSVGPINAINATAASVSNADLLQAIRHLTQEVSGLRREIASMRDRNDGIENVVYREINLEQAIKEVADLLQEKGELYPSDISEQLHIDYDLVLEALDTLRTKGKVA